MSYLSGIINKKGVKSIVEQGTDIDLVFQMHHNSIPLPAIGFEKPICVVHVVNVTVHHDR